MDELTHMATVEVLKDKHARVQVLEQQLAECRADLDVALKELGAALTERDGLREIIARLDAKTRVANTDIAKVRSQLWSIQQTAEAALAPEEKGPEENNGKT